MHAQAAQSAAPVLAEGEKDGQDGHFIFDGVVERAVLHGAGLLIVHPHCLLRIEVDDLPLPKAGVHLVHEIFHRREIGAERPQPRVPHEPAARTRLVVPRRHRVKPAELPDGSPRKEGIEKGDVIGDADRALFFERAQVLPADDAAAVDDLQKEGRDELQNAADRPRAKGVKAPLPVAERAVGDSVLPEGDIVEIKAPIALERRLDALALFQLGARFFVAHASIVADFRRAVKRFP